MFWEKEGGSCSGIDQVAFFSVRFGGGLSVW